MSSRFEQFLASIKPSNERNASDRAEATSRASEAILRDLAGAGYEVATLAGLRRLGRSWESALPILLDWLPKTTNSIIKEEIVRSLSVPWVGRRATAQLIKEFKCTTQDDSLAWAIGNALSIVDVTGFENEIVELVRDDKFGAARQMLLTALGKIGGKEAEDAAISALQDKQLVLHAIDALGMMHSNRSVAPLKEFLHHEKAAVRKEARKALQRLGTGSA